MRLRLWLPWLLVVCACSSAAPDHVDTVTTVLPPTTVATTVPLPSPPPAAALAPPPGADVMVATSPEGTAEIAAALDAARERWATDGPTKYAYRVRIACDCRDDGETWVRVFDPDWPDDIELTVDLLYERLQSAVDGSPSRVEAAFNTEGVPVWFAVDGDESEALVVEEFHELKPVASPYDGDWRFVGGNFNGEEFGNPSTGLIIATLDEGSLRFPIDCNQAGGPVDIHGRHFGMGLVGQTLAGCMGASDEGRLFADALAGATLIDRVGAELAIWGESGAVRLVPLEQPDRRGPLPLTAAGETLLLPVEPDGLVAGLTISPSRAGLGFDNHPGRNVTYRLTPAPPGPGA